MYLLVVKVEQEIVKDAVKVEKAIIKDVVSGVMMYLVFVNLSDLSSWIKSRLPFFQSQENVEEEIVEVEKEIVTDVKKIFGGRGR